eukprot:790753-Heterocapsa_arctica.AAC.1
MRREVRARPEYGSPPVMKIYRGWELLENETNKWCVLAMLRCKAVSVDGHCRGRSSPRSIAERAKELRAAQSAVQDQTVLGQ